jgi:hypothetical protein
VKKIISLFARNYGGDNLVRDEIVPGAEWVIAGEGVATRKWDGTCCLMRGGKLYKRYDAKRGKTPPPGFEPAQDYDPITGHMPGWIAVGDGPEDKWHRSVTVTGLPDGTYELCGPKVNGNPEGLEAHVLIRHGDCHVEAPRYYAGLRAFLSGGGIEGVVWHHPDGRMVKIKACDFGVERW